MAAGAGRRLRRADAVARLVAHELLYDAVLQRVEGDYDQPPAATQYIESLSKGRGERVQFVVYGDANGLESAGRGVDASAGAAGGPGDHGRELGRRRQRSGPDDGAGDAPAGWLLAVAPDEVGKVALAVSVDYLIGGHGLAFAKAHVQRRLHLETEATSFSGELVRRDSQVKQDAVDGYEVRLTADGGQVTEVRLR